MRSKTIWCCSNTRRASARSVKWIRNTPTPSGKWQDLKVRITGAKVEGYVNGKLYLEDSLPAPVSGKIGVWSKADSVVISMIIMSRQPHRAEVACASAIVKTV